MVVAWPLLFLRVLGLWVVLFEADVPGQAADGRHGLELVDDISWDEVNVVVTELDADIANAFPPQLVELGIIHPLDALRADSHSATAAPPSDTWTGYFSPETLEARTDPAADSGPLYGNRQLGSTPHLWLSEVDQS